MYLYINKIMASVAFGAPESNFLCDQYRKWLVGPGTTPSGEVLGATVMPTEEQLRTAGLRAFRQHVMHAVAARQGDVASAVWRRGYQFHPGRGWTETEWAERVTGRIFNEIAQVGTTAAAAAAAVAQDD